MGENAVTLKLPNFWTSQPEVWFTQAEAQFHVRGITVDATKYYHVIASLDQDTAGRLLDVIRAPPDENKYGHLKTQLLRTFGLTRRDRAAKLLDMTGLGDRKPSQLLAEMRSLSDGHTACMLFEEIFLRQMPDDIRMQLAQQDFSNLDAVAERADALWQTKTQYTGAGGINKVVRPTRPGRQTPTTIPEANIAPQHGWCFYHAKFGTKAKKCRSPCTFPGNDLAGRQ